MTIYVVFCLLWTLYMGLENYLFVRPQNRPHFSGFLITNLLLAPFSFVLSLTGGILRERLAAAYRAASGQKESFSKSGRKKLID